MTEPTVPTRPPMRRRWLYAGAAGLATLAGITLGWRNRQLPAAPAAPEQALWELSFPTPGGAALSMRSFAGKPLLLNFWATWCPPCIDEMPLLDRFYIENHPNGWQVLGLAADQSAPVQRFLHQTPVRFPIALAGLAGIELSRTLGNQTGGLPFSVLFSPGGAIAQRKIGQLGVQDLQQWQQQDWPR